MKTCTKCHTSKNESEFYPRYSVGGTRNQCKLCVNAQRSYDVATNMASSANQRSKKKGGDTLTKQDIVSLRDKQNNQCALTGWELDWVAVYDGKRTCPPRRASLDRIDSSRGYFKDNLQLVCDIANRVKSAYSQEVFIDMCKSVAEFCDSSKTAT